MLDMPNYPLHKLNPHLKKKKEKENGKKGRVEGSGVSKSESWSYHVIHTQVMLLILYIVIYIHNFVCDDKIDCVLSCVWVCLFIYFNWLNLFILVLWTN